MSDQHDDGGITPLPAPPDGVAPPPAESAPRRSLVKMALTAMAGVLVVAAVGFAIVSLSEGDGAASAEDAVEDLFDAVDRQDAIGVAESLEPTERRILVDALKETEAEARRVEVTDDRLDLRSVEGVDLSVEGLRTHTSRLDDDTVAVDIDAGRISSRAELAKMPIGPVIQEVIDRNEDAGREAGVDEDEIDLTGTRLVAVERGGQWYVSALYSLAEAIRLDLDPIPAYPAAGTAIPAVGADSPEAAVRDGVAAAVDADVRRLIELTPADEARVLHTYGPILVQEAAGEDPDIAIDDLELEVSDAPDGRKRVSATSMTMTVTSEYDRQVTAYDGACSTTTWEVTDPEAYGYDDVDTAGEWKVCDEDQDATLTPFGFFNLLYAPGSLDVIVEQHDGKWFLSPTATGFENTVGAFADLDGDQVRRIARAWGGDWWLYEPEALWEACGVAQPSLDDTSADAEDAYERCMESLPDDYQGPWGPFGAIGLPYAGNSSYPGDECYGTGMSMPDTAEIEACLAGLVEAGELDPSELAAFRCNSVYDEVAFDEDLSEDEYDALLDGVEESYEACLDDAGVGGSTPGGSVTFGSGEEPETTASTAPPPATTTTTRPPVATTTTTRPATTTTSQP